MESEHRKLKREGGRREREEQTNFGEKLWGENFGDTSTDLLRDGDL